MGKPRCCDWKAYFLRGRRLQWRSDWSNAGFSFLTILIACLGLFGLASFTAEVRTKEIGLRKVMGASAGGIVFQLSKDFT